MAKRSKDGNGGLLIIIILIVIIIVMGALYTKSTKKNH